MHASESLHRPTVPTTFTVSFSLVHLICTGGLSIDPRLAVLSPASRQLEGRKASESCPCPVASPVQFANRSAVLEFLTNVCTVVSSPTHFTYTMLYLYYICTVCLYFIHGVPFHLTLYCMFVLYYSQFVLCVCTGFMVSFFTLYCVYLYCTHGVFFSPHFVLYICTVLLTICTVVLYWVIIYLYRMVSFIT